MKTVLLFASLIYAAFTHYIDHPFFRSVLKIFDQDKNKITEDRLNSLYYHIENGELHTNDEVLDRLAIHMHKIYAYCQSEPVRSILSDLFGWSEDDKPMDLSSFGGTTVWGWIMRMDCGAIIGELCKADADRHVLKGDLLYEVNPGRPSPPSVFRFFRHCKVLVRSKLGHFLKMLAEYPDKNVIGDNIVDLDVFRIDSSDTPELSQLPDLPFVRRVRFKAIEFTEANAKILARLKNVQEATFESVTFSGKSAMFMVTFLKQSNMRVLEFSDKQRNFRELPEVILEAIPLTVVSLRLCSSNHAFSETLTRLNNLARLNWKTKIEEYTPKIIAQLPRSLEQLKIMFYGKAASLKAYVDVRNAIQKTVPQLRRLREESSPPAIYYRISIDEKYNLRHKEYENEKLVPKKFRASAQDIHSSEHDSEPRRLRRGDSYPILSAIESEYK